MSELEDDQFEKLLLEKQHREMISSLKMLVTSLEKIGSNDILITQSIQQNSENIIQFIEKVTTQKLPEISQGQERVSQEIESLYTSMRLFMDELRGLSVKFQESIDQINNKKPTEYEFIIDRGFGNRIEKVTAKPK